MKSMIKRSIHSFICAAMLAGLMVTGQAAAPARVEKVFSETMVTLSGTVRTQLAAAAQQTLPATGTGDVFTNKYITLDRSTAAQGYVRLRMDKATDKEVRVYLYKGSEYDAFILDGSKEWYTLGLTNGDGVYTVKVYEHAKDNLFFNRGEVAVEARLADAMAPFKMANQKIDYTSAPNTVAKAAELTRGCNTDRQKIEAIHSFVATGIRYDYDKAAQNDSTGSFRVPDLDEILASRKGVCVDYSALMCGMLRSQGIAARMEYGYLAGGKYHAWVSAYDPAAGWVRFDPSTYSVGYQVNLSWVNNYIADNGNYSCTEVF